MTKRRENEYGFLYNHYVPILTKLARLLQIVLKLDVRPVENERRSVMKQSLIVSILNHFFLQRCTNWLTQVIIVYVVDFPVEVIHNAEI
jgi:hypothetical protein